MTDKEYINYLEETITLGRQVLGGEGDFEAYKARIAEIRSWGEGRVGNNLLVNKKLKNLPDFDSDDYQKGFGTVSLERLWLRIIQGNAYIQTDERRQRELRQRYVTKMNLECKAFIYYFKHKD